MGKDLTIGKVNVTKLLTEKYRLLKTGWVTLVEVPADKHMEVNKETIRVLVNDLKYACIYITFSKSSTELDKLFKAYGVNTANLMFIDAISRMYGESVAEFKRCTYVSGPLDIEAMTAALSERLSMLQGQKACVFLDSVTTILLYNSLPRTLRFSQFLTKTLKEIGVTGVMVSIAKGDATKKLVTELSKLCDEVVNVAA
jgi:KaiC/GvpD/RAD55 family RecA-like ATPase